jgi:hypothetical protein
VISHPRYEGLIPKLKSNKNLRDTLKMLRGDHCVRPELSSTQMAVPFGAGVALTLTAMGGTVLLTRRRRPSRSPR